ncbi:MAG: hypothetical protein RBR35_05880 [Salinivirgaceae bacterium]|nr:hypothetical protein [Salinivirgaceae bacterium]MDY0280074.1 hypothetical protein [Salinivirgaceae bacterium]
MKKWDVMLVCKTIVLLTLFVGCSHNKFKVDLKEKVVVEVVRLDSVMFEMERNSVIDSISTFYGLYPDFFDIYMRRILRIGGRESSYFVDYLQLFLDNPDIRESYDSVKRVYGDFSEKKRAIEDGFSYAKYHLPNLQVPKIYTVISGFNESMIMIDSAVGISLDKFLGSKSYFYERLATPIYTRKRNEPFLLEAEVLRNWLYSEYPNGDPNENLINTMIYHGKIMYIMDASFPDMPDHLKISFTPAEIIWAKKSEHNMWAFLIDKKLLFAIDKHIGKYVDEAPFVSTFGEESPGRVGVWIGWQIVRSFMDANPNITISQLMEMNDHHEILVESEYVP